MQDKEQLLRDSVKIVLMRTTHPGNIGAVARAMKNMGFRRLCLVEPLSLNETDDFPCFEATRRASGAVDLLKSAETVETLDQALAGCHLVVGASARSRKMVWPLMNPRDCAALVLDRVVHAKSEAPVQVALLFGQESSGLSNEELQRCHYHVNVPADPAFSSLNLAMAVQVICYELRMCLLLDNSASNANEVLSPALGAALSSAVTSTSDSWDEPLATVAEVEGFFKHLEKTLIHIGFYDPANPGMLTTRLRRLFQRTHLDKMEVNILRGILTAMQKQGDQVEKTVER